MGSRQVSASVYDRATVAVLLGRVPRPPPGQAMAEEPVKPRARSRKDKPVTLSMFERALTLEQQREKEPVGAGP